MGIEVVVYLWVLYLPLEPLQALKIAAIIPLFLADYLTMMISQAGCQPRNLSGKQIRLLKFRDRNNGTDIAAHQRR